MHISLTMFFLIDDFLFNIHKLGQRNVFVTNTAIWIKTGQSMYNHNFKTILRFLETWQLLKMIKCKWFSLSRYLIFVFLLAPKKYSLTGQN